MYSIIVDLEYMYQNMILLLNYLKLYYYSETNINY